MTEQRSRPVRYADAGVDIDAADATVRRFADIARATRRPEVLSGIGAFAGLFRLGEGYRDPVLVASADGVGTKLLVGAAMGRFDTVGQDLVNHCVNDILALGARPLFFLDYLATADLSQERRVDLVAGIGRACEENRVALLGGETADMPDLYRSGDYDLAGFIVGVVERDEVLDGSRIEAGDALVALPSNGLQTNGYSLVRELWAIGKGMGAEHDRQVLEERYEELGSSLGDALLAVHPSYLGALEPVLGRLRGVAHITGGGIPGNVPRIFPEGLGAEIDRSSWQPLPVFELIQRTGSVEDAEMFRTFNMGVGVIVAVAEADADEVVERVPDAWRIGRVVERGADDPPVRGLE